MSPCTLVDALAELPDPAARHGLFHPVVPFLRLVVLAMLMDRTCLNGIARFGRQYGLPLAQVLGFRRGKIPAVSTLSRTFRRFDADQLRAVLSRSIARRVDPDASTQIPIDSKTLRRRREGDVPGRHLLAANAPAVGAVLAQVKVDASTNEPKAALRLLGLLPLHGKVVVGDATSCQRDVAETIVDRGGDYVITAKGN